MATLRCDRWELEFPAGGESRDVTAAEFGIGALDSSATDRPVMALATSAGGLSVIVPYTVPVTVDGTARPVFAVLQHRDLVRIGEYECELDALRDGSDAICTVCNDGSDRSVHRRCPLCAATYCPECEQRATGQQCVGQNCRFRFPPLWERTPTST
jgi:hypothetical protein